MTRASIRARIRPACCYDGPAACGGTCAWAEAEQDRQAATH